MRICFVSVWLLLPFGLTASAQQRDYLRDVRSVQVHIKISRTEPADDLKRQLVTDVELRLRRAGIVVKDTIEGMSDEEFLDAAHLYVMVTIIQGKSNAAMDVSVNLKRVGRFGRHIPQNILATVWENGVTILSANPDSALRQQIADNVDGFINDYLAANPKP
jgi:type IV pilus biogenesis protein CpaD/CtpE